MKSHALLITGLALSLVGAGTARAEVAAAFAEGQGAEGSGAVANGANLAGLGYRLGARVLLFEGYYDHTGFGDGAAVSRGILGLRGGFGSGDVRLVLRAGAGVLEEDGGAITGRVAGMTERRGAVGRIGGAVETRLARLLYLGVGLDGETFVLPAASGASLTVATPMTTGTVTGADLFANLHLTFELGV
jgi:hypothetical protein